jgi:DnaJ-class molecular chaperone
MLKNSQDSTQKDEPIQCGNCQGTGKIQPYGSLRISKCQKCQGTGFVSK